MFSTDVLSLTSIACCTGLSVGATALLMDGPSHDHESEECVVMVERHIEHEHDGRRVNVTVSRNGNVVVVGSRGLMDVVLSTDAEVEKCRKKRRRHRHRVETIRLDMDHEMEHLNERIRERISTAKLMMD